MLHPETPSTPEFAAENGYSDILNTSIVYPQSAQAQDPVVGPVDRDRQAQTEDRRVNTTATLNRQPLVEVDPWTSNTTESPAHEVQPTPQPRTQQVKSPELSAAEYNVSLTAKDLSLQYCERGSKSLAAKDYAQARSAYNIAVEWDAQQSIAHSGLAQVYFQIQDYESALREWDLAIGIDRTQIDFYYQRALVCKTLKNYFQVLADCKQILTVDPQHPSARWLNAVALVKTENYQVALSHLDLHIDTYPEDPNGYCYRGICYERLEQYPQALAAFDRAIALQSHYPVFHHARGRTRHKLGDLPGALADFTISIDLKPQAAVYDDRAEVHRCLGDCAAAVRDCNLAIKLNPRLIKAYFRRGLTHAELGKIDLALQDYSQTIDLDPQHLQAYIQRSWIYFRQADYPRAKSDCKSARSIDEKSFWANYILGIVNSLLGLKHNALTDFTKAIEISPYYVSARYHRGTITYELGDIPKAMADFEQARSIQDRGLERLVDRDETGFYAEGLARNYLGQPESARTILKLGALSAKRFNNPSFQKLIQSKIEELGLTTGDLSMS